MKFQQEVNFLMRSDDTEDGTARRGAAAGRQEEGGRRLRQVIWDGKWPGAALRQERPGHTVSTSGDTLTAMHRPNYVHSPAPHPPVAGLHSSELLSTSSVRTFCLLAPWHIRGVF